MLSPGCAMTETVSENWQDRELARAMASYARGELAAAQKVAQAIIRRDRNFSPAWFFLSKLAQAVGQKPHAVKLLDTALQLQPGEPRYLAFKAYLLATALQVNEALQLLAGLASADLDDALIYSDIGNAYHICGELELARAAFQRALDLAPDSAYHQYNLATSCKFVGEFEQAEALADQVLVRHPDDWTVYEFRSGLRKQTPARNHVQQLEGLLDKGIASQKGEVQVACALGKEYEDLGDLGGAFRNFKRAADRRREGMDYRVSGDVEAMATIAEVYDGAFFREQEGCADDRAIFIVGLPRTGTTLLERIISAHTDVFAAGELQNFGNELIRLVTRATPGIKHDKVSMVRAAAGLDHRELGQAYIDSTRSRTGNALRFIDKLPMNYLYLGAIAAALPGARLIHMDRHPMDAAYAIYKTLFTQAYPFSYSLEDLGHYYVAYRKLMDHWHTQLGERLLHVQYEQLVGDPEGQARRVIAALGLDWQDGCLEFYKSAQPTNTASAVQVRQPVYASSVAKWRQLEDELRPFRDILERAGLPHDPDFLPAS